MIQLFLQIIRIILASIITFASTNVYAAYGDTCVGSGYIGTSGAAVNSNALQHLLSNIDMVDNTPNGCNQPPDQIQFCIRGQGSDPCDLVTLNYGDTTTVAAISNNPDIGGHPVLGSINLQVDSFWGQFLCVSMPTPTGLNPFLCRHINTATDSIETVDPDECKAVAKACYETTTNSQSLLNFSGLTVQCLTESLDRVFFEGVQCDVSNDSVVYTALRPFPEFQSALKQGVLAALILYVMFFGFKLVMDVRTAQLNSVALFLIKFVLVAYFSIGLGPAFYDADLGKMRDRNGMTEWALPALAGASSSIAQMVFKAAGSQGLCQFDEEKYNPGYEYYALWDAIDCRLGFYLGMQAIYNMSSIITDLGSTVDNLGYLGNSEADFGTPSEHAIGAATDAFNLSIFTVLFGFAMAGNIVITLCGLVVAVMLISVLFYFLTMYIVCTVTLYVLAYVSPIFIPMALFERTKNYFRSWLNVTLSVVLQPAVIAGFIALLLTFYDTTIFGNCEYRRHDYAFGDINFSTFEPRVPSVEPEKCIESPGYRLIRYYTGAGWDKRILIIFEVPILKDIWNLTIGMAYVLIFMLIFYFMLKYVSEFASDLTSGPSVESAVVSATLAVDAAMKAAKKLADAKAGMGKDTKLPDPGGGDDGDSKNRSAMGSTVEEASGKDAKDLASSAQQQASSGGGGKSNG